jgi:hypothetical protein
MSRSIRDALLIVGIEHRGLYIRMPEHALDLMERHPCFRAMVAEARIVDPETTRLKVPSLWGAYISYNSAAKERRPATNSLSAWRSSASR